ncbi:MAG: polysaccharide deacetylase family protein [Pseudomonadota bacterium]
MTGTAIISLDCEGRWGVADHLSSTTAAALTNERLRGAYEKILSLFDSYDVSATFAFVGLFARSYSAELLDLTEHLAQDHEYLKAAAAGLRAGDDGWVGDWAADMIGPRHEFAFHGLTHVPWNRLTDRQATFELEQTRADHRQTMVFPRNIINHVDILERFGVVGYRARKAYRSRLESLASEFHVFQRSQNVQPSNGSPVPIPSGFFVNWRSGLRKLVPPMITRSRARHILRHAEDTCGTAHFWIHPENVASAPETIENLTAIVEEIAARRDAGGLTVMTQHVYCKAHVASGAMSFGLDHARQES